MLKILMATFFDLRKEGGVTNNLKMLIKGLRSAGCEVDLFHGGINRLNKLIIQSKSMLFKNNLCYIDNYFFTSLKKLNFAIKKAIKRINYDVYHFHDAASCGYMLDKLEGRFIITVHGPFSKEIEMNGNTQTCYYDTVKKLEKICFTSDRVSKIITVDTEERDILLREYKVPLQKIEVIYNCIDSDGIRPGIQKKERGENYILLPRRLVAKNGCDVAIRAMMHVKEDIRLLIAGDGPLRKDLSILIDSLSLKNKVKLLGEVPNDQLIKLMQNASLILVPSVPISGVIEATSIAALEAMSAGKVVIGSNIGGIKEIIKNGYNGILVDPGDHHKLASAINFILENEDAAVQIGKNARNYVVEQHSLSSWVKRHIEIYKSAIHGSI